MIFAAMVVIACVLALVAVLALMSGRLFTRNSGKLAGELRPLDVAAFRNLMDEREEEFLRQRLSPADFRRIHRERMLAAAEYVWGAARNAGILIQLSETAKHSSEPAVVAAAQNLQENAFQLRLYTLQILPRLYASMLVTSLNGVPGAIPERYDSLTRQMVTLTCLQSHNYASL